MPTYRFKNKISGKEWEEFLTISEMEELLEKNTSIEQMLSAPAIVSGRGMGKMSKPDNSFRDVLKQIKKNNIGSNIETF